MGFSSVDKYPKKLHSYRYSHIYEVVLRVDIVIGKNILADDLFAEIDGHVVGVVGVLDDARDDVFREQFGQHWICDYINIIPRVNFN